MIFVSYDPQANGEDHTADDLELINYFTVLHKTFLLERKNGKLTKNAKLNRQSRNLANLVQQSMSTSQLSASLCSINTPDWCCFGHFGPGDICLLWCGEETVRSSAGYFPARCDVGVGACGHTVSQSITQFPSWSTPCCFVVWKHQAGGWSHSAPVLCGGGRSGQLKLSQPPVSSTVTHYHISGISSHHHHLHLHLHLHQQLLLDVRRKSQTEEMFAVEVK